MAGRKPKLNWTKSIGQYTVTLGGRLHRLGTDRTEAEHQFRFLLNKLDLGEWADLNPTFAEVANHWLEHVKQKHDAERYRLRKARLNEFIQFVGCSVETFVMGFLQPRS